MRQYSLRLAHLMRIWIVNHHADPPDGLATRSFDISRRFVASGNPTTIFVCAFSNYHLRPMRSLGLRLWKTEDIDGVRMVWITGPSYRANDWRRVLNMLTFSVLAVVAGTFRRERPDIVVGVSVHPLAALSGWLLARLKGARFFFEVTDLWPESLIEFGRLRADSVAARAMRRLERFLFVHSERIVMLWRHTDEYVAAQGVSPAKILWVPHGVELERYERLRPYEGGCSRPFKVMFVGGIVSGPLDGILDAAQVLQDRGRDDVCFVLVGAGHEKDKFVARARETGLRNVEFRGAVPKREISKTLEEADAFIYGVRDIPLYRFGLSMNKVTDYLAAGRPIIFFGHSTYDPVRDAAAGYSVPPGDATLVADAIERLVALSPRERMEMGERGRQYLVEHHNIPVLSERLMAAFEKKGA